MPRQNNSVINGSVFHISIRLTESEKNDRIFSGSMLTNPNFDKKYLMHKDFDR